MAWPLASDIFSYIIVQQDNKNASFGPSDGKATECIDFSPRVVHPCNTSAAPLRITDFLSKILAASHRVPYLWGRHSFHSFNHPKGAFHGTLVSQDVNGYFTYL